MIDYNTVARIECIKGFIPQECGFNIMAGEQFYESSEYDEDWIADKDSRMEGMITSFSDAQLVNYFKYIGRKTV